eukprot:4826615-Pyramimonas_sp.AAC.1
MEGKRLHPGSNMNGNFAGSTATRLYFTTGCARNGIHTGKWGKASTSSPTVGVSAYKHRDSLTEKKSC